MGMHTNNNTKMLNCSKWSRKRSKYYILLGIEDRKKDNGNKLISNIVDSVNNKSSWNKVASSEKNSVSLFNEQNLFCAICNNNYDFDTYVSGGHVQKTDELYFKAVNNIYHHTNIGNINFLFDREVELLDENMRYHLSFQTGHINNFIEDFVLKIIKHYSNKTYSNYIKNAPKKQSNIFIDPQDLPLSLYPQRYQDRKHKDLQIQLLNK